MKWLNELSADSTLHPIDLLEEFASAQEWESLRSAPDEVCIDLTGRWSDYHLYFLWQEDLGALYFSLAFDAKIPVHKMTEAYELIAMVNSKLWLGHFEINPEDNTLMFRHTIPMRGTGVNLVEILEDVLDTALLETNRFYPAFQFLIWGGKTPAESLEAAMFETMGDA